MQSLSFVESSVSMPLLSLPVRSSVADVDGGRVLISPSSSLTEEQLRALGDVTDIVAPSLLHTAGMKRAASVFPRARLWGPEGCEQKLPTLAWTGRLGVDPWPWEAQLPFVALRGQPAFNEVVFLHRPSRSLLVADLVFNLVDASGAGAWLILHLFGTWRRFGVSRLFLKEVKDRAAFKASVEEVLALDFDHVVPSHGAIAEGNGKALLKAALVERAILSSR